MRKHFWLALRIFFALAGLTYIVYSLDWVNRVEVKPGTVLPNAVKVIQPMTLRVIAGEVNPAHQTADLTLQYPPGQPTPGQRPPAQSAPAQRPSTFAPPTTFVVTAAALSDSAHYRLRASIVTTIRRASIPLLLLGLLLVSIVYPIQTYRWYILLRCRGIEVTFAKAFKLTMIGCFFNYCMPGSTGGDVVKAYYTAANSTRRSDAVMTVLFDRITGLLGLVALGGIASLFMLRLPLTRHIAEFLWGGTAVGLLCAGVYFSRRLRRRLGVNWVLDRLPGSALIKHVDEAAVAYANHKGVVLVAVLISIPVHLALTGATVISGYAVGMQVSFGLLMTVVPIIFLSGTLPISPQGAGVWEALGAAMLLNPPMVTFNQIVAMLVMVRLYQLVYSAIGSAYLLQGDVHLHPEGEKSQEKPGELRAPGPVTELPE